MKKKEESVRNNTENRSVHPYRWQPYLQYNPDSHVLQNKEFHLVNTLQLINLSLKANGTFRCKVSFVMADGDTRTSRLLFLPANTRIEVLGNSLF